MKSLFLSQSTQLKEFKNYKIASYALPFNDEVDSFQATLDFDTVLMELQKKIGGSVGYLTKINMTILENDAFFYGTHWDTNEDEKILPFGKYEVVGICTGSLHIDLTPLQPATQPDLLLSINIGMFNPRDFGELTLTFTINFMAEI